MREFENIFEIKGFKVPLKITLTIEDKEMEALLERDADLGEGIFRYTNFTEKNILIGKIQQNIIETGFNIGNIMKELSQMSGPKVSTTKLSEDESNMKKKDLRERLVDIMHYDGTYTTSDLVKFIQQELDRARKEMITEIYNFVEGESGKSGRKEILEFISKLTTK